ncbi:MAG: GNAT family N-acetyltransferase [Anaerolineae bacterium]|nr:GNAT family N-acetyltransferase [Anaerolineae bacterium]
MEIRPAQLEDLPACAQLDGSYQTDWVWQMEAHSHGAETRVAFRPMRLPRTLTVPYPLDEIVLEWDWRHEECFLVAEEDDEILGCLDMRIQPWERLGWIYHLVVDRSHRRRGLGTALLRAGMEWAREEGLRSVMLQVATKNYPAIQFAQRRGFTFCGYSDLYFASRDIALFFARGL